MKYSDRLFAAKRLYRHYRSKSLDGPDTLLKIVEHAIMAGMERSDMKYNEAVSDWLKISVRRKSEAKEEFIVANFKKDRIEMNLLSNHE